MTTFAIILNGTSSSGKTSIAKEIQKQWNGVVLRVSLDDMLQMVIDARRDNPVEINKALQFCVARHYEVLRSGRNSGFPVILDSVLLRPEHRAETLSALEGIPQVLVGVKCALEEAERREKARSDRNAGTARRQFENIHKEFQYDLEIDTEKISPAKAAESIISLVRVRAQGWGMIAP